MQLLEVESSDDVFLFRQINDDQYFLYAMSAGNASTNPNGVVYIINDNSVEYTGNTDAPFDIENCEEFQLSVNEIEQFINDRALEFTPEKFKGFIVPDESMNGITVREL